MNDFKKKMLPVVTFARIDIKRLFRDKVAIFWVFFFPLLFLFIFGTIFNGNNNVTFRVGLINESKSEIAKNFSKQIKEGKVFKVDEEITSKDKAKEKMNRGQLDATIILPANFGEVLNSATPSGEAVVLYDQSNQTGGTTLASVLETIFKDVNKDITGYTAPFTVKTETTATKGLRQFDYTFSGILGFTLLSLGVFGPTTVFPRMKQRGVLRRYHTTTLKVWQYFTGNVLSNAFVGLLSLVIMFTTAVLVFDLNMRGNYVLLAAIVLLGTILLFGIGLAIGGWAKNENQAAPLAQVVTLPMMFLSGVFFPTFIMPELLQSITRFIPLTAIIDSIRLIITEGAAVADLTFEIAVIMVWIVAIYIAAFKLFRWE